MKKILMIATAALLFTNCNRDELERSNHQKDSLLSVLRERTGDLDEREASINDFISSFNEVERNLDSVASKQHVIYVDADKSKGDLKASQKDRINANINAINNLMEENRKTISELRKKLKGSSKLNAKMKETIATLQSQLAQKDQELAALNEKLNALNAQVAQLQTSVDTLTALSNRRGKTIEENTATMHTAYYVVGRSKELREAKLIDRKGGLLGMGKTSQLSSNIDNSKFTKIDYTQTTSIPINSDNVKIVTTHPTDSYKMETDTKKKGIVRTLVITNPEKFWSASKYLVIEGNPVKN
jgi:DNA repair exonuclease SbcCD ATPase subunit